MRRAIVFAVVIAMAGCAAAPITSLADRPAVRALAGLAAPALPYRVAVAPAVLEVQPIPKEEKERFAPAVDSARVAEVLASALSLPGATAGAETVAVDDEADLYAAARAAGADLVLVPRLTGYEVEYAGMGGGKATWSTIASATLWFPQWWMADERFAATIKVEAEWLSVHTRQTVARTVVSVRTERLFSEVEKGWTISGTLFNWPGSLSARHFRRIAEILVPLAEDDLREAVVACLQGDLAAEAALPEFRSAMRKRLALVVGIAHYADPHVGEVRHAVRDAGEVADWLKDPAGGGLLPEHVLVRTEATATASGLDAALSELASLARSEDTVIVYCSAVGTATADSEPALCPQDAVASDLAGTALPLGVLAERLAGVPGRRLVVVLDVGFGGEGGGRSVGLAADPTSVQAAMDALVAGREEGFAIAASSPPGGALEKVEEGHGLLTAYLLAAAKGNADLDHDAVVSEAEAVGYLGETVVPLSIVAGTPERPVVVSVPGPRAGARPWLALGPEAPALTGPADADVAPPEEAAPVPEPAPE